MKKLQKWQQSFASGDHSIVKVYGPNKNLMTGSHRLTDLPRESPCSSTASSQVDLGLLFLIPSPIRWNGPLLTVQWESWGKLSCWGLLRSSGRLRRRGLFLWLNREFEASLYPREEQSSRKKLGSTDFPFCEDLEGHDFSLWEKFDQAEVWNSVTDLAFGELDGHNWKGRLNKTHFLCFWEFCSC